MRSRIFNRLRARSRSSSQPESLSSDSGNQQIAISSLSTGSRPTSPTAITRFYEDLLHQNLTSFNSFALQSRSVLVRNVYARAASNGLHDMLSLQTEIDDLLNLAHEDERALTLGNYDLPVLLSLSNYLFNTSRSDLDIHAGTQILRFVLLKHGADALSEHDKLQLIEALASIGAYEEQDKLTEQFDLHAVAPVQVALLAIDRLAHQQGAEASWLAAMNEFYMARGMHTIQLNEDDSLPLLDRLTSVTNEKVAGPLVSVIIPTFSPDRRIYTAVNSLLNQTWKNLEILIVDDGSPAAYDELLSELEELDPQIRVIRQQRNGGAYTARNAGLVEARGLFVTTHDDDDWSHPDKIAEQASVLMENESIVATTAGHIRTTSDMKFRRINKRPLHLQTNYSSLMFRKNVTEQAGNWDTSKRGSDTEFVERIRAHFGKSAVVNLADKPLSFSRVWDGSLTSGEIYRGYFAYSRLLYRWAFQQWHAEARQRGEKPILRTGDSRPFATPTTLEPANRNKDLGLFDVIYLTDFRQRAKYSIKTLQEMKKAVGAGLRVGYMQVNSPQTVKRDGILPELFGMQHQGQVTQVAETDRAEAKLMVVHDSAVGMFLDQFQSAVVVRRGIVVHDAGVLLKGAVRKSPAHPAVVLRHLDTSFKTSFYIAGADLNSHEALESCLPQRRLLNEPWKTPIDPNKGTVRTPSVPPVVGFHSFGNKYRWPSTRETFQNVYISSDFRTFFYGNVSPVRELLGAEIIQDEQVTNSDQESLVSFLDKIDFWVYYPHQRLGNHSWAAVLEALQAGKVVILPHSLKVTYGDAAVYADSDEINSVVAEYSNDVSAYIEQATRAKTFIARNYSETAYVSRLESLQFSLEEFGAHVGNLSKGI